MRIARVLVDSALPQLDRLLDYRIPDTLEGVAVGVRVAVPLRSAKRTVQAFVVELAEQRDYPGPLSDVDSVVSSVAVLRPEVWELARAVADRAAGSVNDVLRLAIPPRQVRVEKAWLSRGIDPPAPVVPAPLLDAYPAGQVEQAIAERRRIALTVDPGVDQLSSGSTVGRWATVLSRAAARVVAAGESAILIAPDFRDQSQLAAALAEVLPPQSIVALDARQPNADRYRGLLRAIGEAPLAILGNRSAVYAPAAKLGLIAIWNDGDPVLAEPLSPYVHARDAALLRQQQQVSALIIAGHTRTTEVQRLVELGWLEEHRPQRERRPRVIPTASIAAQDRLATQARIPSIAWREATKALALGPVLVQVARPGYTPGLRCAECSEPARCRRCAGPLQQTRAGAAPSCGWCGAVETAWACPNCRGTKLIPSAPGADRTADELGRAFPGARVIVADGAHPILEVDARPALIVATRGAEPIAAGGYRAVMLLDGERMVARESLRVGEDCLRWWADAAALAADDAPVVLVGVGGQLATALSAWRPEEYARAELAARRELRFPPAVRFATVNGAPDAVASALEALPAGAEELGTTVHDGRTRAILRFDYSLGTEVARAIRAQIIRQATTRRKPIPGAQRGARVPLPLRARFDDPEPFEE